MTLLKNNVTTSDIRMDRIVEFDERSRSFPIRSTFGASSKLRSYTWRCNATLDQGRDGACVGFGVAHELIARPSEVPGLDAKYAKEDIYWEAQKIDPWIGGSYPGAEPFYEGTSVLAGAKIAKRLGWMDSYRWAFGINDLLLGVGHNGPALIGVNWYEGMYYPDNSNYIHKTGRRIGGHCLLVNSINVREERLTLHNSWGPYWGRNGEAYISFADMEALLNEQGEACFFLHRHRDADPE